MGVSRFWGLGENLKFRDMPIKQTILKTMNKYLNSKNINKEILDKIFFYNAYNFFNK